MKTFLTTLEAELDDRCQRGILKGKERVIEQYIPAQDGFGPRVLIQDQGQTPFLCMNSNSYLGLSHHPDLIRAAEQAAHDYGVGPGGVRFISGTTKLHIELEEELARFHSRPAAMIFNCAYAAVLGVLSSMVSPETVVLSDELNHNSIINGLRLSKPAAKMVYTHLNMTELEALIKMSVGQSSRILVVSDGVFSMRGDHAPLVEITALAQKYDAEFNEGILVIIDDSHGVGVFGETGRGTEEYCGAQVDLLIGTLGKGFGVNGGYVTGDAAMIRYLRETAPCYIYSNPVTPAEAAAAQKSVQLVDSAEGRERLNKLRLLTQFLEHGLMDLGFKIIRSDHPIVPIVTGATQTNRELSEFLLSKSILVTPLSYPVVPLGADEIRLQVSAAHSQKDIDYLLAVMAEFADK